MFTSPHIHRLEDDCQDWTLKETTTTDGWMIVEFSRLIDTKDNQDHSIKNDVDLWTPATRIIAAWGDSDDISYHGQKKARGSVRLFATHSNELSEMEAQIETLEDQSDEYFDFTEDNFTIPAVDTHYEDVCKEFDQFDLNLPEGQDIITMVGGECVSLYSLVYSPSICILMSYLCSTTFSCSAY